MELIFKHKEKHDKLKEKGLCLRCEKNKGVKSKEHLCNDCFKIFNKADVKQGEKRRRTNV